MYDTVKNECAAKMHEAKKNFAHAVLRYENIDPEIFDIRRKNEFDMAVTMQRAIRLAEKYASIGEYKGAMSLLNSVM